MSKFVPGLLASGSLCVCVLCVCVIMYISTLHVWVSIKKIWASVLVCVCVSAYPEHTHIHSMRTVQLQRPIIPMRIIMRP